MGCLLALVLEGAALLAGLGWAIAALAEWRPGQRALGYAFIAFTFAAAAVAGIVAVLGNTRRQREIRRLRDRVDDRA